MGKTMQDNSHKTLIDNIRKLHTLTGTFYTEQTINDWVVFFAKVDPEVLNKAFNLEFEYADKPDARSIMCRINRHYEYLGEKKFDEALKDILEGKETKYKPHIKKICDEKLTSIGELMAELKWNEDAFKWIKMTFVKKYDKAHNTMKRTLLPEKSRTELLENKSGE